MGVKNSLKRTNPDIAKEWHPTKNGDLTPEMVTSGSSRIVWWMKPYTDPRTGKCFEFEWQARIVKRTHKKDGRSQSPNLCRFSICLSLFSILTLSEIFCIPAE